MDKDKDGKVSLSEWLSVTEAIADVVGEEPFLTALLQWSKLEKCGTMSKMKQAGRLNLMITTEMTRKKAEEEPFEGPGSAGLTPPFADAKSPNVSFGPQDDALDLRVLRQAIASCLGIGVFRCSCVSTGWKERWAHKDSFPSLFHFDFSTGVASGVKERRLLRQEDVERIATRISDKSSSIRLNFERCNIDDRGARAVAEHLPKELSAVYSKGEA